MESLLRESRGCIWRANAANVSRLPACAAPELPHKWLIGVIQRTKSGSNRVRLPVNEFITAWASYPTRSDEERGMFVNQIVSYGRAIRWVSVPTAALLLSACALFRGHQEEAPPPPPPVETTDAQLMAMAPEG